MNHKPESMNLIVRVILFLFYFGNAPAVQRLKNPPSKILENMCMKLQKSDCGKFTG